MTNDELNVRVHEALEQVSGSPKLSVIPPYATDDEVALGALKEYLTGIAGQTTITGGPNSWTVVVFNSVADGCGLMEKSLATAICLAITRHRSRQAKRNLKSPSGDCRMG